MSRHVKLADSVGMDKEQLLAPLQAEHQSDIRLAYKYFCNFTAISTVLFALYILVHILLSKPGPLMGLEFNGLDLPDSFGELITAGVLVLQFERLLSMISRFVEARVQRGMLFSSIIYLLFFFSYIRCAIQLDDVIIVLPIFHLS